MDTKKILNDPIKAGKIVDNGKLCTKKLIEKPTIENLFSLSQTFAEKTGLLDINVQKAINAANKYGMASMCMLGNSLFAIGKTNELKSILSNFGEVYVSSVDEIGTRFL
jgi:pantoate kinase